MRYTLSITHNLFVSKLCYTASISTIKNVGKARTAEALHPSARLSLAIRSEYLLFSAFGIIYATFLSRLVGLRELLGGIDAAAAGVLLLGTSLGSVVAAPIAGALLERFSVRKLARITISCSGVALICLAFVASSQNYALAVVNCFVLGICFSMYNVSVNVSGVAIEKRAEGRVLMPRFHSFFQIGAVIATVFSHIVIITATPLTIQYIIVSVLVITIVMLNIKNVYRSAKVQNSKDISSGEAQAAGVPMGGGGIGMDVSKRAKLKKNLNNKGIDSTLIIIGLMVLSSTLCEGSGNDWIAQGLVEGFNQPESTGLIGMWVCLLTTAATRFFGVNLIDKFGRKRVMRICFTFAFFGVAFYVFSPIMPLAIFGCLLWGIGVSLGYPIGISAASEGSHRASFRASIVATLGTTMNIAGPPLIGLLASSLGIRSALVILLPATVLGFYCARVLKRNL